MKKAKIILFGALLIMGINHTYANDCSAVLKLSSTASMTVLNEKSFIEDAKRFCEEYSKNKGSAGAQGGNIGYGGFSLGYSSANTNAESISKQICKSSDTSQLRDNAYSTYVKSVAPQAFDSYNKCIEEGNELGIDLVRSGEKEAAIRVSYNTKGYSQKAVIVTNTHSSINCTWSNRAPDAQGKLTLENGQSAIIDCKRESSNAAGAMTVLNENSSAANSYLTIPWAAYSGGVPTSLEQQYHQSISDVLELKADLLKVKSDLNVKTDAQKQELLGKIDSMGTGSCRTVNTGSSCSNDWSLTCGNKEYVKRVKNHGGSNSCSKEIECCKL